MVQSAWRRNREYHDHLLRSFLGPGRKILSIAFKWVRYHTKNSEHNSYAKIILSKYTGPMLYI